MPWEPQTDFEQATIERFRTEVCRDLRASLLQHIPEWTNIAIGFFLGSGFPLETAKLAARYCGHIKNWWIEKEP